MFLLRVLAYGLGFPILLYLLVKRLVVYIKRISVAGKVSVECRHCKTAIPLVGGWQCRCGIRMISHFTANCPGCFAPPPAFIHCPVCGVSRRIL